MQIGRIGIAQSIPFPGHGLQRAIQHSQLSTALLKFLSVVTFLVIITFSLSSVYSYSYNSFQLE